MRVYRNDSIDRLMARRSERLSQSTSVFDNYLTSFMNNKYGGSSGSSGVFDPYNVLGSSSGDIFDPYNMFGSSSDSLFGLLNTTSSGLSYNASLELQRSMISNRIETAASSGKPMTNVTLSEYMTYYLEKNGSIDKTAIQLYKQAVKGDNAALQDKQWRTDPDYIIPERLYKNPLILADKEAALDKLVRNEELEDWEQRLLDTLADKK